jgi:hypothetical protein
VNVFIVPRTMVRFTFYSPSMEGSIIYSLIILGLNYIRSSDPTKLPEFVVDSGLIIALWPVPSALREGSCSAQRLQSVVASHPIHCR